MHEIQRGFTLWKKQGVRYLTIPSFEKAGGIRCAFSTRVGGVSQEPFNTLNFSRKREQNDKNFLENMRRFSNAVGFNHENAVAINYAHGATLYRAKQNDVGCGIVRENVITTCDGLYTNTLNLPLVTFHADCVPLYFYDIKHRAVAICHAGWRGVASHIVRNAIESLLNLGCSAKHILAAVGPCISVKHFEVGQDVSELFKKEFDQSTVDMRADRVFVDLVKACVIDMQKNGVYSEHITVSDVCTFEDKYLFFSHRRDKGMTGAMASVIELID